MAGWSIGHKPSLPHVSGRDSSHYIKMVWVILGRGKVLHHIYPHHDSCGVAWLRSYSGVSVSSLSPSPSVSLSVCLSNFHKWIYHFQALTRPPPDRTALPLPSPANYCWTWPWEVRITAAPVISQCRSRAANADFDSDLTLLFSSSGFERQHDQLHGVLGLKFSLNHTLIHLKKECWAVVFPVTHSPASS